MPAPVPSPNIYGAETFAKLPSPPQYGLQLSRQVAGDGANELANFIPLPPQAYVPFPDVPVLHYGQKQPSEGPIAMGAVQPQNGLHLAPHFFDEAHMHNALDSFQNVRLRQ